jgi:REP element-mobilizing transposase RayT
LRVERDDILWFVTCRTIEERFWLHPIIASGLHPSNRSARRKVTRLSGHADKRFLAMVRRANARKGPLQPTLDVPVAKRIARGLVGSALARAQQRYDVEVFALVVMSNHIHMVVRTPGKNLAGFMGYFKARVANSVNRITGKRGPLWSRRYDAQPIVDDVAAAGSVAYSLDNPVSAKLVSRHDQWPGLNLAYGFGDNDRINFEFLNCTAWHKKQRPENLDPFFETASLRLSPVPACAGMNRDLYRRSVLSWLRERKVPQRNPAIPPLSVEKIVHAAFDAVPRKPGFGRRSYVFGSKSARIENHRMMSVLQAAHARCSARFLSGDRNIRFPTGTYPPPIVAAA